MRWNMCFVGSLCCLLGVIYRSKRNCKTICSWQRRCTSFSWICWEMAILQLFLRKLHANAEFWPSSLLIWPGCLVLGGKAVVFGVFVVCFDVFDDLVWVRLSWGICWCLVRRNSAKQAKKIKRKITNFKNFRYSEYN